jgi:hypothetical protein
MRFGSVTALLIALACDRGGDAGDSPELLRRDVRDLQQLLGEDAVPAAMQEVDDAVAEGKPVLASELLEAGALSAARRQHERAGALSPGSAQGRSLARRLARLYEQRIAALTAYRDALARGEVEDMALVEALRRQREADEGLLAIHNELDAL